MRIMYWKERRGCSSCSNTVTSRLSNTGGLSLAGNIVIAIIPDNSCPLLLAVKSR